MAWVDEANARLGLSGPILNALKDFVWAVAIQHQDETFTLRVWFFRKTFKIRDLFPVFELILGPAPQLGAPPVAN